MDGYVIFLLREANGFASAPVRIVNTRSTDKNHGVSYYQARYRVLSVLMIMHSRQTDDCVCCARSANSRWPTLLPRSGRKGQTIDNNSPCSTIVCGSVALSRAFAAAELCGALLATIASSSIDDSQLIILPLWSSCSCSVLSLTLPALRITTLRLPALRKKMLPQPR